MLYAGIRWPHHSWREIHQSWMLFNHLFNSFLWCAGWITISPWATCPRTLSARPSHFMYHWGCMSGSTTSPDREQMARRIAWLVSLPLYTFNSCSFSTTSFRASNLSTPCSTCEYSHSLWLSHRQCMNSSYLEFLGATFIIKSSILIEYTDDWQIMSSATFVVI